MKPVDKAAAIRIAAVVWNAASVEVPQVLDAVTRPFRDAFSFLVSHWSLILAWAVYLTWQALTKFFMGVLYIAFISEGLRIVVPTLAMKLYKIPGCGWMKEYEAFYRLDLAPFIAFFLLLAVWFLWSKVLDLYLQPGELLWNRENRMLINLAFVMLGADACLFYAAMTEMGWGGGGLSFSALFASAAYIGMVIFVTYVSLQLYKRILERRSHA